MVEPVPIGCVAQMRGTRMKAVIMAGGKGTRLFPYTAVLPKPLMPIGEMPILEVVLRQLARHGINDVVLAVNHMHHLIRAFFGDGRGLGMRIDYLVEDRPQGTCGAVAEIVEDLSDDFLVMNGDVLTNLDFSALMADHFGSGAGATVATFERSFRVEFGVMQVSASGDVERYVEKPETRHRVGMGVYVLKREAVADLLIPGRRMEMPELLQALIAAQRPVRSYSHDGLWLDIGRPEDYASAQALVAENPSVLLPDDGPASAESVELAGVR